MFVAFFAASSEELISDRCRIVSKSICSKKYTTLIRIINKLSFSTNAADETWFKPKRSQRWRHLELFYCCGVSSRNLQKKKCVFD